MTRSHARQAELALLLEVASTPTLGNVDRDRDLPALRFEHFLAGAVGAGPGLALAESDERIGRSFLRAVEGMADQRGGNTQFGALLLLTPLVRAASTGSLTPDGVEAVVGDTTVADAADFYRAFDRVDVFVDDPPTELDALDVRKGAAAVPTVEERGLSLIEVMNLSAPKDDVAREWTRGFPRSFAAAEWIASGEGWVLDRGARAHLRMLADRPDTLVVKEHGEAVADEVRKLADRLLRDEADRETIGTESAALVEAGVNPGTTADLLAAGFYIALERGVSV